MFRNRVEVDIRRTNYSYPVLVRATSSRAILDQIFSTLSLYENRGERRRAFVFIDQGFARTRPDFVRVLKGLWPSSKNRYLLVPSGESSKSLSTASKILGDMIAAGLTRSDLCLAVGGGVVGDLVGFVASLYARGISVVHIPTTLLSMVDSSVGGKTGVNHPLGKNLIGTFHQPTAVIDCLDFVQSLPDSDFQSGLGEVFKYGVGLSPSFYRFLLSNSAAIHNREAAVLSYIVSESVRIKSKIVGRDERESGVSGGSDRRLLNLGHTLGHGLEKAYKMPHGVAVAVGITLAARFSREVKLCSAQCYDDVMELASRLALKTETSFDWSLKKIMPYVYKDKKTTGKKVNFVGLKSIGKCVVRPTRFSEFKLLEGSRE